MSKTYKKYGGYLPLPMIYPDTRIVAPNGASSKPILAPIFTNPTKHIPVT